MADDTYRVKKTEYSPTDPSSYIDVELGGVNTTATDLTLVGRTREYGELYNENILHLLENFASPEVPDTVTYSVYHAVPAILINPVDGQTWFNSTRKLMYTYFRGRWMPQAYTGDIASNWGTLVDGQTIPRPVSPDGYVFPYKECAMFVAPAYLPVATRGQNVSVNATTGVVTATYIPDSDGAAPAAGTAFYQIIGVRQNDFLGGSASAMRVVTNTTLVQETVPPISSFPRTVVSSNDTRAIVTVSGIPSNHTATYTWKRVMPSASQGFPAGYSISTGSTSNQATFTMTINSPGVFNAAQRITRGATFVCQVDVKNASGTIVDTKLSLPIRVEFKNF